jgi:hypothetical protein
MDKPPVSQVSEFAGHPIRGHLGVGRLDEAGDEGLVALKPSQFFCMTASVIGTADGRNRKSRGK